MRKLNKEDLVSGAVVGLAFIATLKWFVLITVPLCAILWALGGAENIPKACRRFGVPVVLSLFLAITAKSWLTLLSIGPMIGALSIGYGIPDDDDEGSSLGRFWYFRVGKESVDFFTRGTIGFLIALAMITLAWSSVVSWLLGLVILTLGYPCVVKVVE